MITVYGRATSSNVQIAMWTIGEIGLEYERLDIGHSYGGNDTPEYLAMNPNGLVPTIRDGDLVLWEAAAIMRYLAARYGDEDFWPRDPAVRAPLDMVNDNMDTARLLKRAIEREKQKAAKAEAKQQATEEALREADRAFGKKDEL